MYVCVCVSCIAHCSRAYFSTFTVAVEFLLVIFEPLVFPRVGYGINKIQDDMQLGEGGHTAGIQLILHEVPS